VQADLEAAHLLRPITFGAGDPKVDQGPLKEWRYTKRFSMPSEYQGKRLTLVFDGVDMDCEVRFNGVRLGEAAPTTFAFDVASGGADRPALLRFHTADQSADQGGAIEVVVNGIGYRVTLPQGLGLLKTQPDHLAYAATASLPLPAGTLLPGGNRIVVRCAGGRWATLDALVLVRGGSENQRGAASDPSAR
jgi:hypothetical protein